MVKIRLTRLGDKKSPFYRVVVSDSRNPRDGEYIDLIGTYDPIKVPHEIKLDSEKAKKWLSQGAQPTDTARSLMVQAGIIPAVKVPAKTGKTKKKEE